MAKRVIEKDYGFGCAWSVDCMGAPFWIDYETQYRMRDFATTLLAESTRTPDMPSLNSYYNTFVFVYGSLKRGFPANDILDGSRFVTRGWTYLSRFKMVQEGFPAAIMVEEGHEDAKAVQGEVFLVPTTSMKHLDTYEANGALYRRRRVAIDREDGVITPCWMYLAVPSAFSAVNKTSKVFTRKKNGVEYYSYVKS